MPTPMDTSTDVYLLVLPALFGLVLAFAAAAALYHCITYNRVKATYEKRIHMTRKRLRHRLRQCEERGVVEACAKVRELGLADLCEDLDDDDAAGSSGKGGRHSNKSGAASPRTPRDDQGHRSGHNRGGHARSSFVLDDVSMIDSEEEMHSAGSSR